MINSAPNNSHYKGGNYIPKNKDKVMKLNDKGGIYYRSSWELKIIMWLDNKEEVVRWGSECLRIPYQMTEMKRGNLEVIPHSYFPDYYYELKLPDGSISHVVAEVKPKAEYEDAIMFSEGRFNIPEGLTPKKLKNLEYRFKMAHRNSEKFKTMINWCNLKGYKFIVITEDNL